MAEVVDGSCLCGGVRYEVELPFLRANHCHCSLCRKHSGTFGLSQGRVPREQFRLLEGEELLHVYRPETGTVVKVFCSVCGSSLFGGHWPEGDEVSIRLGSLDGDPEHPAAMAPIRRLARRVGRAPRRRPAAIP